MLDSVGMKAAISASKKGECLRKKVGCAIFNQQGELQGIGANYAVGKACLDVGCDIQDSHCVRCMHAEMVAILGLRVTPFMTVYVTVHPCWNCAKALYTAGIRRIVYGEDYRKEEDKERFLRLTYMSIEKFSLALDQTDS